MVKNSERLFVEIIWGYSKEMQGLTPAENYFLHPLAVAKEVGFKTLIFLHGDRTILENDKNFDPNTEVVMYQGLKQYILFVWRYRHALFYVNSFTVRSLLVPWIAPSAIFAGHRSLVRENKWRQWLQSLVLYRYKKIRVFSAVEKAVLDSTGLKNKAIIIPLVVDGDIFRILGGTQPQGLVYLGNITAVKNLKTIFMALALVRKKFPEVTLSVVGRIKDQTFYQQAKDCGVADSIRELGWFGYQALPAVLNRFSVLVNSSTREGQCLAVYEGALCGLALCLPQISSFAQPFQDKALFHSVFDHAKLADNIVQYMSDEELRLRHNSDCRMYIIKQCNAATVSVGLKELFLSFR